MCFMNDLKEKKTACRGRLRKIRDDLDETERRRYDTDIRRRLLALPRVSDAKSIFIFISHGSEVDTRLCLEELHQLGKTIVVPRIMDKQTMIAAAFESWESLQPEQMGILAPRSREPVTTPIDVCITPGVGFSPAGGRLGYGRGYYDRWFSSNPPLFKVAPAYECQILEDLPWDETDIPVDMIVTESRIIRIS